MLTIIPSSSLFITTLTAGTFIRLSSPQWLFIWAGLELNLLSFIPLIVQNTLRRESEGAVKYFLTQSVGSALLLLGGLTYKIRAHSIALRTLIGSTLVASLLLKIGAAPLHIWFPQVISCLSWPICIILSTWQKLGPLILLSGLTSSTTHLVTASIRSLVGGLGGLNQTQLRPLLAYSSIGHLGWIIAGLHIRQALGALYFLTYTVISLGLIYALYISNSSTRTISRTKIMPQFILITTLLLLLSLGGLPPLLGFFPKWSVIRALAENNIIIFSCLIITGALINLFYYIIVSINIFVINKHAPDSPLKTSPVLTMAGLTMLGASPLLIILFYALTLLNKS